MINSIIVRYSEIGIKGKNRVLFEKKLVSNIKRFFKKNSLEYQKISRKTGRIIIEIQKYASGMEYLKNVFGIISFSPSMRTNADIEDIKNKISFFLQGFCENENFRISADRITKTSSFSSMDIEREIGAFVVEKTKCRVKLKNFDKEIGIEIIGDSAYVFDRKIRCFGGLPVGIEGKAISYLDSERMDASIVASLLAMKRGISLIFASTERTENVDTSSLEKFCFSKNKIFVANSLSDLAELAEKQGINAVICPDTIEDMKARTSNNIENNIENIKEECTFLMPLVAFNNGEITELMSKFGV
ncbi:MAG TPA: THUMP domain-containing protein [Candidatus Nanoarchaeia archaeon]|nr:THUMP domain-containing protein [Candidatus Nanoarchaeia archaeon]